MNILLDNSGIVKVEVTERLAIKEVDILRKELLQYIEKNKYNFIFDFEKCNFMDSTGLGLLISIHKRCVEHNGKVKLCCLSAPVAKIIDLTRLNQVLEIYKSYNEALKS